MRARRGSDDRRVIFLHLPKTGGSTLRRIIEREYPADAIFTIDPDVCVLVNRFGWLWALCRERACDRRPVPPVDIFQLHVDERPEPPVVSES